MFKKFVSILTIISLLTLSGCYKDFVLDFDQIDRSDISGLKKVVTNDGEFYEIVSYKENQDKIIGSGFKYVKIPLKDIDSILLEGYKKEFTPEELSSKHIKIILVITTQTDEKLLLKGGTGKMIDDNIYGLVMVNFEIDKANIRTIHIEKIDIGKTALSIIGISGIIAAVATLLFVITIGPIWG